MFRPLPEGREGEDRGERLVSDIDIPRNQHPVTVEKHQLMPVVDEFVIGRGFH